METATQTKQKDAVAGPRLIGVKRVREKMGNASVQTLWRLRREDPAFPKPRTLGSGAKLYWLEYEVDQYLLDRFQNT